MEIDVTAGAEPVSLAAPLEYDQARILLKGEVHQPSDTDIDAYLCLFTDLIHRIMQEESQGVPA